MANTNTPELPRDINLYIFSFLNIDDLIKCEYVCKEWKKIISQHDEFYIPFFKHYEIIRRSLYPIYFPYATQNQFTEDIQPLQKRISNLKKFVHAHSEFRHNMGKKSINEILETVPQASTQEIKLVVIGNGAVGKTCTFISYATNSFPKDYVPTVFDNYVHEFTISGKKITLGLWDTAGPEEYDRLRPLSYANSNVFIVMFNVVDRPSLVAIAQKWIPEVNHFTPDVPFIIVGNKIDLRKDKKILQQNSNDQIISTEEGMKMAKEVGALAYFEISALTQENLGELFNYLVCVGLIHKHQKILKTKKKICSIQ